MPSRSATSGSQRRLRAAFDASGAPQLRLRWRTLRSSPALLSILRGHESWAVSVAVAADGRHAVSAGRDGTVRGWDVRTGREEWAAQVLRESGDVWRVALSADGLRAVVAVDGAAPALLDARTGQILRALDAGSREATAVAILADGRRVATAAGGASRHGSSSRVDRSSSSTVSARSSTSRRSPTAALPRSRSPAP